MGTMNTTRKSKEAAREQLQQPLKIDRAATLRLEEESTSEAASLQQKMKVAAKKLVELDDSLWDLQPAANESYAELCYRILGPVVHCIPGKPTTVFFRLGCQWLKLTEENVTKAVKSLFPGVKDAEGQAKFLLDGIREFCKDFGKVSWVLPKLEGALA
jgi:hypothetical protein